MANIINFLKGKKTYITGIVMIVLGLLQSDQNLILQGVGFMTLRAGVAKITTKA